MKSYSVFFAILLITLPTSLAQNKNELIYSIDVQGAITVPADKIVFTISLTEENENPQTVYDNHKIVEQKLIDFLNYLSIPDSNITYSLLSITKSNKSKKDKIVFKTSQNVRFVLFDLEKYEDVQIGLLQNGVYVFRSAFSTTHEEEAKRMGIENAIITAQKEAEIFAENIGMKVSRIVGVEAIVREGLHSEGVYMTVSTSRDVLFDIPQSFQARTKIKIKFALVSK